MLVGQKEEGTGILLYLRAGRTKKKGFSLIEVLVVSLILGVLTAGLLMTLTIGDRSSTISSAKADLQAKVRMIADMITRDVRQTKPSEINNNGPWVNHIKFRLVSGFSIVNGGFTFYPDYIEYVYDVNTRQLTRNIIDASNNLIRSTTFDNITSTRFCNDVNIDLGGGAIVDRKLIVTISAQSQANRLTLNFSLTEEVKIRNE